MAIKTSGPIGLTDIVAEFGGSVSEGLLAFYRGGPYVPVTVAQVPASGPIGLFDFYGATKSAPGEQNFLTPGTFQFIIPAYSKLTVHVRGAGGGGGLGYWDASRFVGAGASGSPGGISRFLSILANGGGAGQGNPGGTNPQTTRAGARGADGTASGGSFNSVGAGGLGGAGGYYNISPTPNSYGGAGGNGGHAGLTWAAGDAGAPTTGQTVTLIVGAGGDRGTGTPTNDGSDPNFPNRSNGDPGAHGSVRITWA